VLTPFRIFLNCFSSALTLRLTRRGSFSAIRSVHFLCTAAHSSSFHRPVAITGSTLTWRNARHSGTRSSSVQSRLDPIDFGTLKFTAGTSGGGEGDLDGEVGREQAPAYTTTGAGLGSRR